MTDLLYEIGAEEIPASYIFPALRQLEKSLKQELDAAGIAHAAVRTTGTPRRLVVAASGLAEAQPDADEEVIGPPARVAFDKAGNPTRAAAGFARTHGVDTSAIERKDTKRGEYCVIRKHTRGRPTAELLTEILPRITQRLAFPKSMAWPRGEGTFARPVRWLLALLGSDVISFHLFGLDTGRATEGHPMLSPGMIEIGNAGFDDYEAVLREHCIIVDADKRRETVWAGINNAAEELGTVVPEAHALADEVVNLVQYPSVTYCNFDRAFLELPHSVITAAMMEHQRYFPLAGPEGLRPHFIVVSDRGKTASAVIRTGNEQVLHARLADARFFYDADRRRSLSEYVDGLAGVQFLKGLGTYRDKCLRLEDLVARVSEVLGLDGQAAAHARRAARLCKADLITQMVGEFPKLQGEVGRIYALEDGEPEPVARAILEHYLPRSAGGTLPATPAGQALSLAEKLDNMVACFAVGLVPTGSADPYALRRQGQAALGILLDSGRHLDLAVLLRAALALLPTPHCDASDSVQRLLDFLRDRLFQMALESGAPHDLIHAVLNADAGWEDVVDFRLRLDALLRLSAAPGWQRLVPAVERTFNISKDAPEDLAPDPALYAEPLERQLAALYEQHRQSIEALEAARKYDEASRLYEQVFAAPLQNFFDKVFVNVEDARVRNNRLALLRAVNKLYSRRIADLSRIVTGVE